MLGLAAAGPLTSSCGVTGAFECTSANDCQDNGIQGQCEATGWCSFPDADCDGGQRYGQYAGDGLNGQCVAVTPGSSSTSTSVTGVQTATGTTDASSSTTSTASTDETPSSSSTTSDLTVGSTSSASSGSGSAGSGSTGLEVLCSEIDDATVALYPFDGGLPLLDATGMHDGFLAGAQELSTVPGRRGCTEALRGASSGFGVIPDHPDFALTEGSFDLWFRTESPLSNATGIVSRDASASPVPGHLTLFMSEVEDGDYDELGHLAVRLQGTMAQGVRCSEVPLPLDQWVHIGVNFGPPSLQLFIDGQLQSRAGTVSVGNSNFVPCNTDTVLGIDGNTNPWTVMASSISSDEGDYTPTIGFANGATLDDFRISSVRRDFSD